MRFSPHYPFGVINDFKSERPKRSHSSNLLNSFSCILISNKSFQTFNNFQFARSCFFFFFFHSYLKAIRTTLSQRGVVLLQVAGKVLQQLVIYLLQIFTSFLIAKVNVWERFCQRKTFQDTLDRSIDLKSISIKLFMVVGSSSALGGPLARAERNVSVPA